MTVAALERRRESGGVRAVMPERCFVKFLFFSLTVSVFLFSANLKKSKFAVFERWLESGGLRVTALEQSGGVRSAA